MTKMILMYRQLYIHLPLLAKKQKQIIIILQIVNISLKACEVDC